MAKLVQLLVFAAMLCLTYSFRTQSVGAYGRLYCGQTPAKDVVVRLIDKDQGERGPDPDDYMEQTTTNSTGHFLIKGSALELSMIDPEIRIYHDCRDHHKKCMREWVMRIPYKYIVDGEQIANLLNIGNLNLEAR
ncbi:unnamed protein product [Auanema sp. JU1783]|nr:unnamed protein product [Auanema sp. JU1783]